MDWEKKSTRHHLKDKMSYMLMEKLKVNIKKKPIITARKRDTSASETLAPAECVGWSCHKVPLDHKNVIISFDVGIINLAYCIMTVDSEDFEVFDWGIINLADGNPKKTCSRKLRNGNSCTKKAYYLDPNLGPRSNGVCKMHKTKSETLERNTTVANITEWELKTMLFQELDSDSKYLDVNSILIESQPTKAREKIKGIGHALFDYYVLRGAVDTGHQYDELKFIDAKNKLTVYTGPPISCHLKTQYARNKWYSERYCQWIIRNQSGLASYFSNHGKKKDDLADCFLQGLWYLKYSKTGKKPPMTSSHQKLVYRENNRLQYKKIRARAPTKKTRASGRYTLSNIKWMMSRNENAEHEPTLKSSIEFFFGDLDYFCGVLKNT
jgi:hypothetical protein